MIVFLITLVIAFHLFLLSRLQFTAWPEMLSYPYLLINHFLPYKDFVIPYPPTLTFVLAAVFNLFGFKPEVLRVFTWILIVVLDLLLFAVTARLTSTRVSLVFVLIFSVFQSFLDGNMLWFDIASAVPVLAGFLLMLFWQNDSKRRWLFLAALSWALAVSIKQTAAIYFLPLLFIYFSGRKKAIFRDMLVSGAGALLVVFPISIYLILNGVVADFWNWVFFYPLTKWSAFPGYVNFAISQGQYRTLAIFSAPAAVGIILLGRKYKHLIYAGLFLVASLVAVYPRFSFFHLQPALIFITIIFALSFHRLSLKFKLVYLVLIFLALSYTLRLNLSALSNTREIRFFDGNEKKLSRQIILNSPKVSNIYFLDLYSSQYVLTNKIPSKPWVDNFGWYMEMPGVQEKVIAGLSKEKPKIIFWRQPQAGNWFDLGVYQPSKIVDYIKANYKKEKSMGSGVEIWQKN